MVRKKMGGKREKRWDKKSFREEVRLPIQEELFLSELPNLNVTRALCLPRGKGHFAERLSGLGTRPAVTCHFLDVYHAEQAREQAEGAVEVVCTPDVPEGPFDLATIAVHYRGDAELTRDLMQGMYQSLEEGGTFLAATNHPEDKWLNEELKKMFPKVTRRPHPKGVLYRATKSGPLKRVRDFSCEFAFRDRERLFQAYSRPGTFNHREIDGGARSLINVMTIRETDRVLDMGCGCGTVTIAAAALASKGEVLGVDSNARAIQCTEKSAALNGLTNVKTLLDASGNWGEPNSFDVVVGNPPYYSHFQISEIFLEAGHRAMKKNGEVLIVTKLPKWYREQMPHLFHEVEEISLPKYIVMRGRKPRGR